MDPMTLAFLAILGAQEGNPCQRSLTPAELNPNQLAFHIENLDKLGVTTVEYVIFLDNGSNEPQGRSKIPRPQLQTTSFINCFTVDWTAPANLTRDGETKYVVVARTENAQLMVSAWSSKSNPFFLGNPPEPIPEPLPLPVPGVRVGTKTP
jgi:hypothetical protein